MNSDIERIWLEENMNSYFPENTYIKLHNMGFFEAPASRNFHGNHRGGLFEHSYAVMRALVKLTEDNGLAWTRKESPYIVGLLHDLCKCDLYRLDGDEYEHNSDTLFKGHGHKSVLVASQILRLTEEEVACIVYHMGAFTEKEEWGDYTRAVQKYPNVLWTHTADMIASHIMGV
jgi:hypothetical protein